MGASVDDGGGFVGGTVDGGAVVGGSVDATQKQNKWSNFCCPVSDTILTTLQRPQS